MAVTDIAQLHPRWPEIIRVCQQLNPKAATVLRTAQPYRLEPAGAFTIVYLKVEYPHLRNQLLATANRQAIQSALARIMNATVVVEVETRDSIKAAERPASTRRPAYTRGAVRSIPTTYAGVEFRSRFEAQTAMLHDDAKINWLFEVEGYDLGGVWYLPDFYLPDLKMFLEVKGILDNKSKEKVLRLADACKPHDISVIMMTDPRPHIPNPDWLDVYYTAALIRPTQILWECVCPRCLKKQFYDGPITDEQELYSERLLSLHYQAIVPTTDLLPDAPTVQLTCRTCAAGCPSVPLTGRLEPAVILEREMILAACPKCKAGVWKRVKARACPICEKASRSAQDFAPIFRHTRGDNNGR